MHATEVGLSPRREEDTGKSLRENDLISMFNDNDPQSVDMRAQLLQYALANQELVAKLAASDSEREALKAANVELTRQVAEMRSRLALGGGCVRDSSEQADEGTFFATACEQVERQDDAQVPGYLDVETANFLLNALQDSPVYVSYSDRDLRYVWCNRTMKGFSIKDVIGKRDDELGPPGTEGLLDALELKRKALVTRETQIAQMEVQEHLSSLKKEVMAHKATEQELRQAVHNTEEAICAKNMFLAIMSHEIRTPLNGLLGLAEALDATVLNAEQQELVNAMLSSGVIIADILGDILDLASMEAEDTDLLARKSGGSMHLEEQPFSPSEAVQDIMKMAVAATREKGIQVLCDVASDVPSKLIGDPLRVRQVMKYLILNAIKFTHVGTVTIRVGVRSVSTPSLETSSIKQEERQGMRSTDFITKRKAMSDVDDRGDSQLDSGEPSASSMYRRTPDKDDSPSSSRSFSTEQKRTHFTGSNSEDSVERLSKVGNSKFENGSILVRHDSIPGAEPRHLPSGWNEATPMVGVEEAAVPHQHTSESMKSQINANAEEVYLWCEIVDTGVGIPEEAFPTLFDKFTQVNTGPTRIYGGTGLGLAICKQLVELMGGELTVKSEVGKGSTFTFNVLCKVSQPKEERPCDTVCQPPSSVKGQTKDVSESEEQLAFTPLQTSSLTTNVDSADASSKQEGKIQPRILLAEDNKVNVMVAISMLKRLGFTAQVVANGVEALEAIRKDHYDLVLLDICMPLMDGLQVAYAIRRYEETGEWPEDDLRDIFASASKSMLQVESDKENREAQTHSETSKDKRERMKNALEGLRKSGLSGRRLPIVAVTANALRSDVDKYFAHGMDAFIAKPVMFQKLRETLAKYLPLQTQQQADVPEGSTSTSAKASEES
ncbi:hypothetical protein AXG93_606s1260 [Marchantia polymorpha subsp. ruderalis]|uniref:histidine kinase n=1 Tax=Marchantia polymorpha subsp. ruderalis TaxID=1480154 RepID=A0A176VJI8_MARPO|nr:hypothetical protein AXG93_606s1260 [Marchantia polymorpha subsp. ruderalis]